MIIPNALLWIVGIAVFALVAFLYLKLRGRSVDNYKVAAFLGFLATLATILLVLAPSKRIVIVEKWDGENPGYYTHRQINAYGFPEISISTGESFPTKGLEIRRGGKYVFNCSDSGMLLYPVAYGKSGAFKNTDDYKTPDPIYVEVGCYDEIPSIPDYWFTDPPSSISESENILETIWNGLFGSVEVKWCITPYNVEDYEEPTSDEESDEE